MFRFAAPLLLLLPAFAQPPNAAVVDAVAPKARAFPLEDVRLLDGPFRRAMEINSAYLLRLEPDRLLSWFRKEAGLTPKGEVYGGWETQGIAGHSLGHYLSALSLTYASTGDALFRDRISYIVDELEACQRANGDGYVAGLPNGRRVFREVSMGDIRSKGFDLNGSWVPWYTLHKQLAGLLDAHRYTGNAKALAVAQGLAGWAVAITSKLDDKQWQLMLACEHGGMNESLAELYARTGEKKYLDLSRRFHHRAVLDPLAAREDRLQGLHANTQIPKLIGLARRYEITGDPADRAPAEFFWDRVAHHHSYVIGGNSDREHFGPPDQLSARLGQNTCETCNTYNMLKLTRHLFEWQPAAGYADYYERALFNHIVASQRPEDGMFCYYVTLRPGAHRDYSDPFNSFWCCVGSGMENHAKYADSIYFHDVSGLWVNLYISSELNWKSKKVTLRQETRFPETDTSVFTVTSAGPTRFTLRLRHPAWAFDGIQVKVNGRAQKIASTPGSYAGITREWRRGDRVEIRVPMSLHMEPTPDNPQKSAVLYGPLVLAGDLGPADDPAARSAGYVPVLITGGKPVKEWLKPVEGKSLAFQLAGVGRPRDVTFQPFNSLHHSRYNVYWDLFTPDQWTARQQEYLAEQERQKRLDAITIDSVQPGEMQSERDHNMQGERTGAGEFDGRKWRDATEGGWFSFDMKVTPGKPARLVATYWGSDRGPRIFDILVNGRKIATQELNNLKPDSFVDVPYELPASITEGRESITIRFQAHPGRTAGGLFGLRIQKVE